MDSILVEVLAEPARLDRKRAAGDAVRTAFSTVVRESEDLACGVFDARGRMMAQSLTGTPGHINAMATGVRHFSPPIRRRARARRRAAHQRPLADQRPDQRHDRRSRPSSPRIASSPYFANTCHAADIGGRILSAEAHEVFEEGLRIPITKLFDRGERSTRS